MKTRQSELDWRARRCLETAFHAAFIQKDRKPVGEIASALRLIYGDDAFARAAEMAADNKGDGA